MTSARNIAHMEMYKVIAEVSLKEVLKRSSLTEVTALSPI
jgi:hypothetical protein